MRKDKRLLIRKNLREQVGQNAIKPKWKYDPVLKKAMKEIDAILDKYHLAGAINIASECYGEFSYRFDPRWSPIQYEYQDGKAYVRFRCKLEDFEGTEEQKQDARNKTSTMGAHLLRNMRAMAKGQYEMVDGLLKMVDEVFKSETIESGKGLEIVGEDNNDK